jgi:lon-related putative ATP-dependent protease
VVLQGMFEEIIKKIKLILNVNKIRDSRDITIPNSKLDQVIGQDKAVEVIKHAIKNRRHVLMIGQPGTGKSLLATGMSEYISCNKQQILAKPNLLDPDHPIVYRKSAFIDIPSLKKRYIRPPLIKTLTEAILANPIHLFIGYMILYFSKPNIVKTVIDIQGENSEILKINNLEYDMSDLSKLQKKLLFKTLEIMFDYHYKQNLEFQDHNLITIKSFILKSIDFIYFLTTIAFLNSVLQNFSKITYLTKDPNILDLIKSHVVWKPEQNFKGFIWSTGSRSSIFGDIKHDPLKGLEVQSSSFDRVCKFIIAGSVHKANKGVLYIDEIGNLDLDTQYEFLTILQEKKYSIRSISNLNSNSFVTTNPLECDFCLVMSGNLETLSRLHPALRSRIKAYGYQVYMQNKKLVSQKSIIDMLRFFTQEIIKNKLKHFDKQALEYLLLLAIRDSGSNQYFTLRLRGFTGYMTSASDLSKSEIVSLSDLEKATQSKQSLEKQILYRVNKEYNIYQPVKDKKFSKIGFVNILAVLNMGIGDTREFQGIVKTGYVVETNIQIDNAGFRPTVLQYFRTNDSSLLSAFDNINAYLPRNKINKTLKFELSVESEIQGNSLGLAVLIACISVIYKLQIKQNFVVTGAIGANGIVKPVAGLRQKVDQGTIQGYDFAIVPKTNLRDIVTPNIKVFGVSNFKQVIDLVYVKSQNISILKSDLDKQSNISDYRNI